MFEIDLTKVDKQKEYPEFCSVCGDALTSEDSITKKINEIKTGYKKTRVKGLYSLRNSERYQRKLRKTAKIIIPKFEILNEQLKLSMTRNIKHDDCEGDSQYCAFDGRRLSVYGFQGTEEGYETNLVCPECRHYDARPMTPKDRRMFLANSPVIAKMLL